MLSQATIEKVTAALDDYLMSHNPALSSFSYIELATAAIQAVLESREMVQLLATVRAGGAVWGYHPGVLEALKPFGFDGGYGL